MWDHQEKEINLSKKLDIFFFIIVTLYGRTVEETLTIELIKNCKLLHGYCEFTPMNIHFSDCTEMISNYLDKQFLVTLAAG